MLLNSFLGKNRLKKMAAFSLKVILIVCLIGLPMPVQAVEGITKNVSDKVEHKFFHEVRQIATEEAFAANPGGIGYSKSGNNFYIISDKSEKLMSITLDGKLIESNDILNIDTNPVNSAFNQVIGGVISLGNDNLSAFVFPVASDGKFGNKKFSKYSIANWGLKRPSGMTVDPNSGEIYILDLPGPQLVRIMPTSSDTLENAIITKIELKSFSKFNLQGLAFDTETGHLNTICNADKALYEFTKSGQLIAISDLTDIGLHNPQAMIFAPSADQTDNPDQTSLYIVDREKSNSANVDNSITKIIELSPYDPTAVAESTLTAALINTIDTSKFTPNPSPDPCSVEYIPSTNRLFISDSEVDEIKTLWGNTHKNLFETDLLGNVVRTSGTRDRPKFTGEPTGVAYDPVDNHLYISDDDEQKVLNVNLGPNGLYDNKDNFTSFSTNIFGDIDPEGLAFDSLSKTLYIVDGENEEVYGIEAGANAIIEGFTSVNGILQPVVDDQLIQFDTTTLGVHDPEGIAFDSASGHLYICGGLPKTSLAEVTNTGTLVQMIDISAAQSILRSGLGFGPSSIDSSARSLYLADRGIDNSIDPNENDGKIYELSLSSAVMTHSVTFEAGDNGLLEGQTVFSGIPDGASWLTAVTVPNPTAASGYHFVDWTPEFPPIINSSETFTANFAVNQYTLKYVAGPNGIIDGTVDQTVNYGSDGSTVTAVPESGYRFESWSDGVTTASRTDMNVQTDINVTATFIPDSAIKHTVTIYTVNDALVKSNYPSTNYGSMTVLDILKNSTATRRSYLQFDVSGLKGTVQSAKIQMYTSGPSYAVGIYPVSNYYLNTSTLWKESGLKWINAPSLPETALSTGLASQANSWVIFDVGNVVNGDGLYSFALANNSINLTSFNSSEALQYQPMLIIETIENPANNHSVTFEAGDNGLLEGQTVFSDIPDGASWLTAVTVPNPTAASGYHFVDWTPEFPSIINSSETFTANFAVNQYTLKYVAGPNGIIDGTVDQTVNYGSDGSTVTAVPESGYRFESWSDGVTTASRTDMNVQTDINVTATFIPDSAIKHTVTIYTVNDALVKSNFPSTNYGSMAELDILKNSTATRRSYLQFDVNGLQGTVQSAKIQIYTSGPSFAVDIYSVSNYYLNTTTLWKESGLKWINAPSLAETALSTGMASQANSWVIFDVGNVVNGDGLYSFALANDNINLTRFNSSEALQYQPMLIIETIEYPSNNQ